MDADPAARAAPADPEAGSFVRFARLALSAAVALAALVLLLAPKPWDAATGPGFAHVEGRTLHETVTIALYYATALNAGLALLLLATAAWWGRALEAPMAAPRRQRPGRRFLLGLLAIVALAGALRLPLALGSLWWDEAWSIRRVVVGEVAPDATGAGVELEKAGWGRTLWFYAKPTNHVTYNLAGRLMVDVERWLSGRPRWSFSDRAFRVPAFVAGLACIAFLGLWLARLGLPTAGLAAAALLALHPWHIRYGVEARAYTLTLLLALSTAWALGRALQCPTWRAWLAYGAGIGLLMWTQPANVYLAVTFTLAALVAISRSGRSPRDRLTVGLRFLVVNGLAAMGFLQLAAPHVAQAMAWTHVALDHPTVTPAILVRLWSWIAVGFPYHVGREGPYHEPFPELRDRAVESAWIEPLVFWAIPLALLASAIYTWRRVPELRAPLLAIIAAPPLLLLVSAVNRMYFYPRFAIYALVPLCVLAAVGAEGLLQRLVPRTIRRRSLLVAAGLGLLLGAFQLFVLPETRILLTRPYAPAREVAAWLRERTGPDPRAALHAGFGLGTQNVRIYDPWILDAPDLRQLRELEARAEASGVPLYVTYGYPGQNGARRPQGVARLDDPSHYVQEALFQGIEPQFTFRILRYRRPGGPAPGASTP